uniref:Uncharacterized protein n=1 Tax=Quercus lobata TaxID=97700 RepID=A0A7N2M942_QUELO
MDPIWKLEPLSYITIQSNNGWKLVSYKMNPGRITECASCSPSSPFFVHMEPRNMVLHQGKLPNPMEVVLTSQSLICKYQEAFQANQEQKPISGQQPQQLLTNQDWQIILKVAAHKNRRSKRSGYAFEAKTLKEMFYSQDELAVEGNPITLQSRMLWVKQFSRLWRWATIEY